MLRRLQRLERRTPTPSDVEQPNKIVLAAVDPVTGRELAPEVVIWERHDGR